MAQPPPQLTDRAALLRNRAKLRHDLPRQDWPFLHVLARDEIEFRLTLVNRTFTAPAIVTGLPQFWADLLPDARIIADEPVLALQQGAHDLLIHAMALHWAQDPVGQLIQARHALRPDGLLLAVLPGGRTLEQLRAALSQAEADLTGGLSARILPMTDIRDAGALLQRAGLALPVADCVPQTVAYRQIGQLYRDLREMGETNALAARRRSFSRPAVFRRAEAIYRDSFSDAEGYLMASFELLCLTGWAPAPDQPQALRPGSAQTRLADALGSVETPLPDAHARPAARHPVRGAKIPRDD